MGIVHMGPPADLIAQIAAKFSVDTFIESGTFRGETAFWASKQFSKVFTIENSQVIFQKTTNKYKDVQNIKFYFGDSRDQLGDILAEVNQPAVLWLDGHWCGGNTYGTNDQCPLLEELAILNHSQIEHFIFIDDARLFLLPPPLPNRVEYWPSILEISNLLSCGPYSRYVVVYEDVIIAVPSYAREMLSAWCQKKTTQAWNKSNNLRLVPLRILLKKYIHFFSRN